MWGGRCTWRIDRGLLEKNGTMESCSCHERVSLELDIWSAIEVLGILLLPSYMITLCMSTLLQCNFESWERQNAHTVIFFVRQEHQK